MVAITRGDLEGTGRHHQTGFIDDGPFCAKRVAEGIAHEHQGGRELLAQIEDRMVWISLDVSRSRVDPAPRSTRVDRIFSKVNRTVEAPTVLSWRRPKRFFHVTLSRDGKDLGYPVFRTKEFKMQTELINEFRVKRTQGNRVLVRARHPRDDFTCWVEDGPVEVRALGDRGIDVQGSIPPEAIP